MDRTYKLKHLAKQRQAGESYPDGTGLQRYCRHHRTTAVEELFMRSLSLSIGDAISSISTLPCPSDSKQTCHYQVVGILDSFISNRQNILSIMSIAAPLTMTPSTGCSLFNKYGLWYNSTLVGDVCNQKGEKKGNRSDVKEYVYTVKRGSLSNRRT